MDPKYIAEGAYGCVYDKPFQCNGKKEEYENMVGKIFDEDEEAVNEFNELKF